MTTTRDLIDNVRDSAETVAEKASDKAHDARDTVLDLMKQASKFLSAIETPSTDDLLDRIGLQRKQSNVLPAIATFGVGMLVGAAAGVLFAPKSGQETREDLSKRVDDLVGRGKDLSGEVTHSLSAARDKAMDVAGEAREKVAEVAGETKEKVASLASETRDKATHLANETREKAVSAASDIKSSATSAASDIKDGFDKSKTNLGNGAHRPALARRLRPLAPSPLGEGCIERFPTTPGALLSRRRARGGRVVFGDLPSGRRHRSSRRPPPSPPVAAAGSWGPPPSPP